MDNNNSQGQYSRNQEKRQSQFIPNINIFNNNQLNPILSENESDNNSDKGNLDNQSFQQQQNSNKNGNRPKNPLLEQFINENTNINQSAHSQTSNNKHINLSNSQHLHQSHSPQPSDFYQSLNNLNDLKKWDVHNSNEDGSNDENNDEGTKRITIIKQLYNDKYKSKKKILLACIILIIGVISGSSLGPFFHILPSPFGSQIIKSLYRQQVMIILNFILVIYEYNYLKNDKFNSTMYTIDNLTNSNSNILILIGAICWSFYILFVPIAIAQQDLEIYVFQAFLGVYPCLQVFYKIGTNQRCSRNEHIGLFISLFSYLILFATTQSIQGCIYSIIAGIFYTFYLKMQSVYRDYYPGFMAQLINSFYSTIFLIIMCFLFVKEEVNFNKLIVFSDKQDFLIYISMGICTGVISSLCFNYSRPILTRQITYAIRGTFPIFSMVIAYLFEINEFVTDLKVWFLLILIVISYFLISSGKTESENLDIEINNKLTSIQEYENNQPQYQQYIELQAMNSYKKTSSLN